jgi:hypothetical protein
MRTECAVKRLELGRNVLQRVLTSWCSESIRRGTTPFRQGADVIPILAFQILLHSDIQITEE